MNKDFYFAELYPMQDQALRLITEAQTGFYLTGGTALSRGYLGHRFSDDLDLFTNMDHRFANWCHQMIAALSASRDWQTNVLRQGEYFLRLMIIEEDVALKVECVNDVPSHIGEIQEHPVLGRLDSPENILANKISALIGRDESKDLVDVWGLCCRTGLSIKNAITDASSKSAGIYPPDLARRLCSITHQDWEAVRWINAPSAEQFIAEMKELGQSLILVE